ncbi:MAG: hypothetical protein Q4F00_12750 [bacterium]|nr:hypothetical protein [bacterium]
MDRVKWMSVCTRCGKACGTPLTIQAGKRPTNTPYPINGKCPSSPDGKHKPKWEKG